MKEQFISVETAKLAKEKGFLQDTPNSAWYNELGSFLGRTDLNKEGKTFGQAYPDEDSFYGSAIKPEHKKEFSLETYSAVSQGLLQKWLREEHRINVESNWLPNIGKYKTLFKPMDIKPNEFNTIKEFRDNVIKYYGKKTHDSYEEALEEGLQEALNLI